MWCFLRFKEGSLLHLGKVKSLKSVESQSAGAGAQLLHIKVLSVTAMFYSFSWIGCSSVQLASLFLYTFITYTAPSVRQDTVLSDMMWWRVTTRLMYQIFWFYSWFPLMERCTVFVLLQKCMCSTSGYTAVLFRTAQVKKAHSMLPDWQTDRLGSQSAQESPKWSCSASASCFLRNQEGKGTWLHKNPGILAES